MKGGQITSIPDKTKEHKVVKPLVGISQALISRCHTIVAEGQSTHPLRLDMKRDGNWWPAMQVSARS